MMLGHQPSGSLMDQAIREAEARIASAAWPSAPPSAIGAAVAPLAPSDVVRLLSAGGRFLFGPEQRPPVAGLTPSEPTIQAPSPLQRLQGLGMNYEPVRRAYGVLPTLLGIAQFGLGGPENAAMSGARHAAAVPLAGAGEEGKNLIQALAPEHKPRRGPSTLMSFRR